MKTSTNLKFQIPELDDQANVTVVGAALEALDNAVGDSLAMNGDASDAQVSFTKADSRSTLETKTTLSVLMGKIAKWLGDLKDAAFQSVANNLTTTASGYVLDARQGKTLNDSVSKLTTQNGGLYFGKDSSGKWGYKESANGTVNPFRNPTGDAVAANVLVGKTFANASSDSLTGTMPNNGSMTATLTPTGNNSVTKTIPAGYTTGGTITANGATAYAAGKAENTYFKTTGIGIRKQSVTINTSFVPNALILHIENQSGTAFAFMGFAQRNGTKVYNIDSNATDPYTTWSNTPVFGQNSVTFALPESIIIDQYGAHEASYTAYVC